VLHIESGRKTLGKSWFAEGFKTLEIIDVPVICRLAAKGFLAGDCRAIGEINLTSDTRIAL
jgi:hypothetical protein